MNAANPLISVVFSFRNEAQNIPELIRRVQTVLCAMPLRYEIIFVNDCSTDDSLNLLLTHRKQDPNIKIINTSRRFGVTPCVMAGFEHAQGDAVIYMDTDLQDPPELIPSMIEKWRQGAEVVHTTRSKRHGENRLKMWITRQAYCALRGISEYPLIDNTGDFKLISRKVLDLVLSMREGDPYLRGLVGWTGFRQEQVFYEREARFAGKTKFPLLRSMNPYREFFRGVTGFSDIPLYFGFFCSACFGIGALLLAGIFAGRAVCGSGVSIWLAFFALFCATFALLFMFLSLMGVYLGAVLRQTRHRPYYFAKELIGFDADTK